MTKRFFQHYLLPALIGVSALYLGIYTYQHINRHNHSQQQSTTISPVFSTQLSSISTPPAALNHWKNKILVVNFWATWCAPCKKEIPTLVKMRQQWLNKDVEFIGIAIDFPDDIKAFIKTTPIPYPVLIAANEGMQLMQLLGNTKGVLPFTAVIDRSQHSFETITGIVQTDDLEKRLKQLTSSQSPSQN